MDKASSLADLRFPVRIMGVLATLTVLLVVSIAWLIYSSYQDLDQSANYLVDLEHCRSRIVYLDEVLSMSAHMAAATNNPKWIKRYYQHQPALKQAFRATRALARSPAIVDAVMATSSAANELASVEREAFRLIRQQQNAQATALLSSDKYALIKERYATKLVAVVDDIQTDILAAGQARMRSLVLSLTMVAALSMLFFLQLFIAIRQLRRWQKRSEQSLIGLTQARAASEALNQQLEQRVEARTSALQASEQRIYSLLGGAPLILFSIDANGVFTLSEGAALKSLELSPGDMVGRSAFQQFGDNKSFMDALRKAYDGTTVRTRLHTLNKLIFDTTLTPVSNPQGEIVNVTGVAHDVTAEHVSEGKLSALSQAIDQHPAGIAIIGLDGVIQYVNPRFGEIMDQESAELTGRAWHELRPQSTSGSQSTRLRDLVSAGGDWRGEYRHSKPDGTAVWLRSTLAPLRNSQGDIHQYLYMIEDISEKRLMNTQLKQQTYFDSLTGLPNRKLALERINAALENINEPRALVLIDLDNFKRINDGIGHDIGDRLLTLAAERINACVDSRDTVARIGGDEFLVLMSNHTNTSGAEIITSLIISEVARPYEIDDRALHITASAGVALAPQDGEDTQRLLRNADTALYQAKAAGRNTCRFFSRQLGEEAEQTLVLEDALRGAIKADELTLHYQPIIDLTTGQATRAEALLRWNSAKFGNVAPDVFIPLAEQSDLIVEIGNWVLRQACAQTRQWRAENTNPITVGVNLSPRQFLHTDFADTVLDILQETSAQPEDIELEITERLLVTDQPSVTSKLKNLDARGVKLCIDDFGTGYSSLAYLKHYPIDTLKIDRLFVRDVIHDRADADLAAGIIKLAHGLSMRVTGEGVETAEQLEFLRREGCDQVQGYFFSKPLPADEFGTWLTQFAAQSSNPASAES